MLGALIIFALRTVPHEQARMVALAHRCRRCWLSLVMLKISTRTPSSSTPSTSSGCRSVGINYDLGIDGIALLLIVLTTLIGVIAIDLVVDPVT